MQEDKPTHACENCSATFTGHLAHQLHGVCPECTYSILSLDIDASCFKKKPVIESADPAHYKTSSIECIDAMRAMLGDEAFAGYLRGTIFKYNWRLGKKDESTVEVEKIAVYARWLHDTLAGRELSK